MGASKHKLQAISAQTREGRQHAVFHPNKSVACIRCVCVCVCVCVFMWRCCCQEGVCVSCTLELCVHTIRSLYYPDTTARQVNTLHTLLHLSPANTHTHTHRFLSHSWSGDLILCVLYDKAIRLQSLFVANYCMSFQVEFNYAISVFNVYYLSSGFITCCKHILGHIIKKKNVCRSKPVWVFFLCWTLKIF